MSRIEYDNTLEDLLSDHTRSGSLRLPQEAVTPDFSSPSSTAFDTNMATQQVSTQLITSAETLAQDAAARAFLDPVVRKNLVPCTPTGPADTACFKIVISKFGRRAFRRALSDEDATRYVTAFQPFAVETADFYTGAELVVRAMLQDPEFLYRLEIGQPVAGQAGVFKLTGVEMATRLSYFLRGTTPDEALLAAGEADQLSTPDKVRAAASSMMTDPRVRERVQQFNAEWLSYDRLQLPAPLAAAMQAESRALLDRVIFDQPSSYLDVFLSKETFIDTTLATQYGLPDPGKASWVSYGNVPRLGILSHGSVLSAMTKAGDTSPTLRGRFISTRLICRPIPPPPPNVVVSTPASGDTTCKKDRLAAHRTSPSCAGCHGQMDPIGFGLENFDREAKYRTTEEGRPQCGISGEGTLPEVGNFVGADGLATAVVGSGKIEDCVVREVFRFAMGRVESTNEAAELQPVIADLKAKRQNFREILLNVAAAESFGFRHDAMGATQ